MNRSEAVEAIERIAGKVYSTPDHSLITECDEEVYCICIVEEDRGAFLEASINELVVAHAAIDYKGSFTGSGSNPGAWVKLYQSLFRAWHSNKWQCVGDLAGIIGPAIHK